MAKEKVTRGDGFLEGWLSKQRSRVANQFIPDSLRNGRILDIGCGSYPYFLATTRFREKWSLDQITISAETLDQLGIHHETRDLSRNTQLPFDDGIFSVVTMLAVIEHLQPPTARDVLREIHRVLIPGGRVIVTTPAAWADKLLRALAKLRIVSPEEIHEHAFAYRPATLGCCLGQAGFAAPSLRCGTFELHMNLWATADKD